MPSGGVVCIEDDIGVEGCSITEYADIPLVPLLVLTGDGKTKRLGPFH